MSLDLSDFLGEPSALKMRGSISGRFKVDPANVFYLSKGHEKFIYWAKSAKRIEHGVCYTDGTEQLGDARFDLVKA